MIWRGRRGERSRRGTCCRPSADADLNPAQVCGGAGGILEGQQRDPVAPVWGGRKYHYVGDSIRARVSWGHTVGRDEASVRAYLAEQGQEDQRLDQLEMFEGARPF